MEAGRNKVFDTLVRFKKNNAENFSEFFASELINKKSSKFAFQLFLCYILKKGEKNV